MRTFDLRSSRSSNSGAGYALLVNEHVRVDIFYGQLGPRGRAAIDVFGGLVLLLPSMLVILWVTWPFVHRSWTILPRALFG